MMNVILRKGWEDREFIDRRNWGFEELQQAVEVYPPEKASHRSPEWRQRISSRPPGYQADKAMIIYWPGNRLKPPLGLPM